MENGCYKLSWRERIGFSGSLLIFCFFESKERIVMDTINMEIANRR